MTSGRFDQVALRTGLSDAWIKRVFRAAVESIQPDPEDWDWHYDSEALTELIMEAFDD